jgi:hypothetical protein
MIGFIGTSLQLQWILTAYNPWLSKTRSIPCWTTSVFPSTVTNGAHSLNCLELRLSVEWILKSESYVTTDGQSASLSWNKAPVWGLRSNFYYYMTVAGLLMWGALSDDRTGLIFTIVAGPRQRSHFRVRVRGTRNHILLSQIRDFPFCRLLRLAGLRWRYSTPPPHGSLRLLI